MLALQVVMFLGQEVEVKEVNGGGGGGVEAY